MSDEEGGAGPLTRRGSRVARAGSRGGSGACGRARHLDAEHLLEEGLGARGPEPEEPGAPGAPRSARGIRADPPRGGAGRSSLRTNWTRLVHPSVLIGHVLWRRSW